jgi:2,4-dienoyl-CoA reductase-like NADH-dependent reductase (Old Yellow Enzyme family)
VTNLLDPLELGDLTIPNRIMMSPMSQRAAGEDGRMGDWHLVHYGSRAVGGCGLVMVEDTAVSPLARTSRSALGLYDVGQAEQLRRTVSFCRAQGAAVGVQLAHAGRKALADTHGGDGTVGPSPVGFGPGWVTPGEASQAALADVVGAFAASARLALEAGCDVVEVHAAHGYLLHQFLSPLTNLRDDAYGVSPYQRRRLLLEVVSAVRAQWPAGRPLFVRLPAGDGELDGLSIEEAVDIALDCVKAGADLIDVTGGTPLFGGRRAGVAETLAFAVAFRAVSPSVPLALGGDVVDAAGASALFDEYGASLVSVGRPLLADPYWALRAAGGAESSAIVPPVYGELAKTGFLDLSKAPEGTVFSPDHPKCIGGSMEEE